MFTEQERLKITFEIKHHTDDSSSFLVLLLVSLVFEELKHMDLYLYKGSFVGLKVCCGLLCCVPLKMTWHINKL